MSWFEQAISNARYHLTQLHRLAELKLERNVITSPETARDVVLNRTPAARLRFFF